MHDFPILLRLLLVQLLLLAGLGASAHAQVVAGTWSLEYSLPGLGQRVYAVTTWQGRLVAGGANLRSGGRDLGSVAIYDGVQWSSLGATPNGTVRAFAVVNGELHVGGAFSSSGGTATLNVARWDGVAWRALGSGVQGFGVNPPIVVLALTAHEGQLWVGGSFGAAGGQPCDNLARWNGAQWSAVAGGVQGPGTPAVTAFLSEGGVLHLVGEFTSAGGVAANRVARFASGAWSALGAGVSSQANCLARYNGDLYVGGRFNQAGGASAAKIARWNGSSWSSLGAGIADFSIATAVSSLAVHENELYVGGNYIHAGGILTRRVARWNGSAWASADGLDGSDLATTAIAMTEWNGALVIGGEFLVAGAPPIPGAATVSSMIVARRNGAWHALGRGMGVDAEIRTIVRWNDSWVVGGRFLRAGNAFATRVAAYDGSAFRALGNFASGDVWDAVVFEGDLVVTGEGFTNVDGVPIFGTARFDGAQWSSMQSIHGYALAVHASELYVGGLGSVRRWNGAGWTTIATLPGNVETLHSHGGLLWIGGNFTGPSGSTNLATWNGVSLAPAPGGSPNGPVGALGTYQGQLVAGGDFSSIGGVSAVRVARFDGAAWHALGPGIGGAAGFTVLSFAELGGNLYAGGSFAMQGGAPGENVVRWDGAQWRRLASNGLDGWVADIEVLPGENALYFVGGFLRAGALETIHIARWHEGAGPIGTTYCTGGFEHACPCGNASSDGAGCANVSGSGARLVANGTTRVSADDLVLTTTDLGPNAIALLVASSDTSLAPVTFGNGLRCVSGTVLRIGPPQQAAAGGVTRTQIASRLAAVAPGGVLAGRTWHIQDWYRDPTGPCGGTANLSNGVSLSFVP